MRQGCLDRYILIATSSLYGDWNLPISETTNATNILQLPRYMGIETWIKVNNNTWLLLQLPRYMGIETDG